MESVVSRAFFVPQLLYLLTSFLLSVLTIVAFSGEHCVDITRFALEGYFLGLSCLSWFIYERSKLVEFGRSLLLERIQRLAVISTVILTIGATAFVFVQIDLELIQVEGVERPVCFLDIETEPLVWPVMLLFLFLFSSISFLILFVLPLLQGNNERYRKKAKENLTLSFLALSTTLIHNIVQLSSDESVGSLIGSLALTEIDGIFNIAIMLFMTRKGWKRCSRDNNDLH